MVGLAAFTGLLLVIGIAACGDGGDDGEETEPQHFDLVIGEPAPLSGDFAEVGRSGEKATDLAVDQINSAISETGAEVSVEIVYGDSGGGPAAAAQAAQRMVEADDASCLVGGWSAEDTLEIATSVSIPEGVLQISPAPADEEVTALEDDELVNTLGPMATNARVATETAADSLPPDESAAFDELFDSSKPTDVKLAPFAAETFDATILCYLAAVAAGSAEGKEMALVLIDNTAPAGTEYSWEELPDAVKALEAGEDIDYMGASGPIDMDENGNASASSSSTSNGTTSP
jgi:ABC-type branched-subunit amino acid transport system substrate-binding protein